MALISKLTAIAEAIRNKTGKTDLLTLEQMPVEIAAIETGGGGDTGVEDALIQRTISGTYENDRITEVGQGAFQGCPQLTGIDLPNVTTLKLYAFDESYQLEDVNLPKVKTVYGYAFRGCTGLVQLSLPALEIAYSGGNYVFHQCRGLKEIKLPKLTNTRTYFFSACSTLEKIILPSVTTITAGSEFAECTLLKKVILPSVTKIGGSAYSGATFKKCTALEALILPSDTMCTLSSGTGAFGNTSTSYASGISLGTGYIYVPAALVDTYKAATNWSAYAEQIRAIEDYSEICAEVLNADGTIKTADEIKAEMEASI